jgi:hypothetical protein
MASGKKFPGKKRISLFSGKHFSLVSNEEKTFLEL